MEFKDIEAAAKKMIKESKKGTKVKKSLPMTKEEIKDWTEHEVLVEAAKEKLKALHTMYHEMMKDSAKIQSHRKLLWAKVEQRLGIFDKTLDVDLKNNEIQIIED